jgi:hypothetical protein
VIKGAGPGEQESEPRVSASPAPNPTPDWVKNHFSKMLSDKIKGLQRHDVPKIGFSHSLALEPTAYSVRSCVASSSGGGSPPALRWMDGERGCVRRWPEAFVWQVHPPATEP